MQHFINQLTLALIPSLSMIIPPASAALAADPNSPVLQPWKLLPALRPTRQPGYSPPTKLRTRSLSTAEFVSLRPLNA